tara:strand:- start:5816 stop:7621 length:1806 start_codon:yes stop_codon:yes gene_type:complete
MPEHFKCDSLTCYDEAKIKKLYVETLEHPDFYNGAECVVLETADTRGISLINTRGKTGKEIAKLKALKSGVGVVINSYEKILEVRTNLVNKLGLHAKILDTPSQTFKQLKGTNGITISDKGDYLELSGYKYKSGDGISMLIDDTIRGLNTNNLKIEECGNFLKINAKDIRCEDGLKIRETPMEYILSTSKLKEKRSEEADVVSLLDEKAYCLNRLRFPKEHFEVVATNSTFTINARKQLGYYTGEGHELIHNDKLKMISGGNGIKIQCTDECVKISAEKLSFKYELLKVLDSASLSVVDKNNKIFIEKKDEKQKLSNIGTGIKLLSDGGVKTLFASGLINLTSKNDSVIISSEFPLTNCQNLGKLLINGNRLRSVVAGSGLKSEDREDSIVLSLPVTFSPGQFKCFERQGDGFISRAITTSGCLTTSLSKESINIHCEKITNVPALLPSDVSILSNDYKIKALRAGENVKIKTSGNLIEISSSTKLQSHTLGHQLIDSNGCMKTLVVKKPLKIEDTGTALNLRCESSLKSLPGDGVSISDGSELKRITVDKDIEIEDRGSCIHISATKLVSELEYIKTEMKELRKRVDSLVQLQEMFNKLR